MRCLVTGGSGFIGSHLVDKLVSLNHEVFSLDCALCKCENPKATYRYGFVQNIESFLFSYDFDFIFHLAALPRIQPSFKDTINVHDSNTTGTFKILEFAKKSKSRVIFAGSSSVLHDIYANPYAFSKSIGEQYCVLYNKIFQVPVAIARFFNVYGPRQIEEGEYATVVGIFEKQKKQNKNLTITGDGEQRRDFTHVDDIVSGLVCIMKTDWDFEIFNLGSGKNYSINEIASFFNSPVEYIEPRKGEAKTTLADIEYTCIKTQWNPVVDIKDYIKKQII
jgi:UDP-glucose 4-epimerase